MTEPVIPHDASGVAFVTQQIIRRYSNPARIAHSFLLRIPPDADFVPLLPAAEIALQAWSDNGTGLVEATADQTLSYCRSIADRAFDQAQGMNAADRKQLMARIILFSVAQVADDEIAVHLLSRSLTFKGKGDRDVIEQWKPSADGGWYSVYRPR